MEKILDLRFGQIVDRFGFIAGALMRFERDSATCCNAVGIRVGTHKMVGMRSAM